MYLMRLKEFLNSFIVTNPASPARCSIRVLRNNISVFWSKFVTIYTMCFASIYRNRVIAKKNVVFCWHCFKMFWIRTFSTMTFMVYHISLGYRSFKKLIRKSMRSIPSVLCLKLAISGFFMDFTFPIPATGLDNNFAQKIIKWFNSFSHCSLLSVTWVTCHYNTPALSVKEVLHVT